MKRARKKPRANQAPNSSNLPNGLATGPTLGTIYCRDVDRSLIQMGTDICPRRPRDTSLDDWNGDPRDFQNWRLVRDLNGHSKRVFIGK